MLGNRLKCLLALLSFLASPARPATSWIKITSANFELYTNAGEKKGREAIVYFEQARGLFGRLVKSKDAPTLPVRIIAFQSETEYLPYRVSDSTDAFYAAGQERDYIVMKSLASQFYPAAMHQYVHLLIKRSGLDLPVWLNEGLAEVYSPLKVAGSQVQLGENLSGRAYELRNTAWLDLPTLLGVDRNSPQYDEKQKAGVFYSESWALTHMLCLSAEYSKRFPDFLALIKADSSQAAAVEKVYGKTLSQLQEDLSSYVRGSHFNATQVSARLQKAAEFPSVKAATDLDSGLALAELLAVTNKRVEAQSALESLAKSYPKDPAVLSAMARLDPSKAATLRAAAEEHPRETAANPVKQEAQQNVATTPPKRSADPVQATANSVSKPAPQKRDVESNAETAHVERPAESSQAAPQPTPQQKVAATRPKSAAEPIQPAPRVETAHGERPAETSQATPQPAPQKKVAAARPKRPAEPVQATKKPAPQKRDAEPNVETAHVERPAEPGQAAPPPAPEKRAEDPAEAATRSAEGTLQHIDCAGRAARLRLLVSGQQMMLLIEDVNKISMKTAGRNVTREFTCGPQEPVTVAVHYSVKPDPMFNTEGLVRTLEFR